MLKKKAVQVLKANVSLICMNTISGGLGITENTAVMYAQIQLHFLSSFVTDVKYICNTSKQYFLL